MSFFLCTFARKSRSCELKKCMIMKNKTLLTICMFLLCAHLGAQTKFSGLDINMPFSAFCAEMSKKYTRNSEYKLPTANSDQKICEFYLTFLGVENSRLTIWRMEYEDKIRQISILLPNNQDKSVVLSNFNSILESYKSKYGNDYERSETQRKSWDTTIYTWELSDAKISVQICKGKYIPDDYFDIEIHYIPIEPVSPKSVTTNDI